MDKMIAFCGLVCSNCPTFLATRNDDDAARAQTAAFYKEQYGFDLRPEDINCDGCLSQGGKLLGYCQSCQIRQCGQERGVANCALCAEAPCEKLTKFHAFSPQAQASFAALQKERG